MEISIRQETPADYDKVGEIISSAFKNQRIGDHKEHVLVARLRKSEVFIPELSLVAEYKGELVGHILFTKVYIEGAQKREESLALAPVTVLPNLQGNGIGAKLIEEGHKVAKDLGFKSVVLLGHEKYYPKFGYQPASKYGVMLPFNAPDENCMALELVKGALSNIEGMVSYPREFCI